MFVDLEADQHFRSVQRDAVDLARLEARNLHRGAGLQAARLGEVGRIVPAGLDERQPAVGQCGQHRRSHHHQADHADDEGIAFRERFHRGVHLPEGWPIILT
ncbi:hypothetical protein MKAN_23015 [Mycobacterium kansasii ATCC 12478]|uniref:Uncharacterized protein n=1 Tax=Mycobacterium kansasii ATCC 12478 TaxID=557599 RepID=U5WZ57_MYCKA|nr:hypothetical protein MKAN_23015 [Mycobacterium kansasii ATCC 12478]